MSRVYRALEKVEEEKKQELKEEEKKQELKEEEKKQEVKEEAFLRAFQEKAVSKREAATLKFSKEKIEELEVPLKEEAPILIVPPNSFAAEEFRRLKTQIFFRLPNPPHSVLITSTTPGEGKSTVSVNLAVAISQEIHGKAILVDGDLRKPSIYLGKGREAKGLSNYLSDGTPLSDILINSEIENLQIIMAGPTMNNSSELIGSKRMGELLKSLSGSGGNPYIIIDSSPIIATNEPTLLSKMVDGIILVVMADRTPRESVKRALKSIDRQKIIGIVFNQIDIKPSRYYSKYYHDRYYKK